MGLLNKILLYLRETKWRYRLKRSIVRLSSDSTVRISSSARISRSQIIVIGKSRLIIGDNVRIENANISVVNGVLNIQSMSIIGGGHESTMIDIYKDCSVTIGHHSKVSLKRIWCRFGGAVEIGNYTNINHDSEIRCDESVKIGSYCQISYQVNIWDTNTHNLLSTNCRKEVAEKYFPYFGYEEIRPKTCPIVIGDFCWLGEKCSVLKGSKLGNNVVVGYNTTIVRKEVTDDKKVISDIKLRIL